MRHRALGYAQEEKLNKLMVLMVGVITGTYGAKTLAEIQT